jgi:hypothetical protein
MWGPDLSRAKVRRPVALVMGRRWRCDRAPFSKSRQREDALHPRPADKDLCCRSSPRHGTSASVSAEICPFAGLTSYAVILRRSRSATQSGQIPCVTVEPSSRRNAATCSFASHRPPTS